MANMFYQQDTICPRLTVQDDILLRGVSLNDRLGSIPVNFTTSDLTTLNVTGLSTLNTLSVNSTTASTSSATGALRVAGGVGISGNLYAGGKILLPGANDALITRGFDPFTSGKLNGLGRWGLFMEPATLTVGIPLQGNRYFSISGYNVDSTFTQWFQVFGDTGVTRILSTVVSTSPTTGALTIAGGAGISKELYVGGNAVYNSNIGIGTAPSYRLHLRAPTADNTSLIRLAMPNLGTTDPIATRIIYGNDGFGPLDISASIDFIRTASAYNGQVAMCFKTSMGGAGNTEHCLERMRINPSGTVNITNTDNSTSTVTGALTVAGGVGVAKSLVIGGTTTTAGLISTGVTTLTGNLTVSGTINGVAQTSGTLAAIAQQPGITFLNEVENNLYWYRVGNIVHCVLMHRCQSPSGNSTANYTFRIPFAPYYPIPVTGTGNYASTRVVIQGSSTTATLMQTDASGALVRYIADSNNQAYFTYFTTA